MTEAAARKSTAGKKPHFFVTSTGKIGPWGELERFAVKAQGVGPDSESQAVSDEADSGPGSSAGRQEIGGLVAPPHDPDVLARLLEINTYHYRATKAKARETAGLGWEIVPAEAAEKKTEDLNQAGKKKIEDFFKGLHTPIAALLDMVMVDYETLGYACIEVARGGLAGEPTQIFHVRAPTVQVHRSKSKYRQRIGTKSTWFSDITSDEEIDANTGLPLRTLSEGELARLPEGPARERARLENEGRISRKASQMMWFRNYTPASPYYGQPDVLPALGSILGDKNRQDYNVSFFANYGVPAYMVTVLGNYDEGEEYDDGTTDLSRLIEQQFAQMGDKPFSSAYLFVPEDSTNPDGGGVEVKIEKIGHEVRDASFRMYRMDNRDEVLSADGVSSYRAHVIVQGQLGGNVAQEATEIYKEGILKPRQDMLEEALNRFIVREGLGVTEWKWQLKELDTRDRVSELDMLVKKTDNAYLSPNDAREKLGLRRIDHPAMDLHYYHGVPIDSDEPVSSDGQRQLTGLPKQIVDTLSADGNGNGDRQMKLGPAEIEALARQLAASLAPAVVKAAGQGPPGERESL